MKRNNLWYAVALILLIAVPFASAHCDHVEGPVIKAANKAIAEQNVNYILIWVQPEDEAKLEREFETVLPKISAGDETAKQDFYEYLVKLHRAGEGAGYDGIKPAGSEMEPLIVAADAAIETGNLAVLHPYVSQNQEFHNEVVNKYVSLMARGNYDPNNLTAGREYVDAYVEFMEFIEGEEELEETLRAAESSENEGGSKKAWILAAIIGIPAGIFGIAYYSRKKNSM